MGLSSAVVLEFSFQGWRRVVTWRWINDYRIFILSELVQLQKEQNCFSISISQSQQNLVLYVMWFAILKVFVFKASALFSVWESQRISSTHNSCCQLLYLVTIFNGTCGQLMGVMRSSVFSEPKIVLLLIFVQD